LKISKITIIFALFIIVSASFMRQVLDFIRHIIGKGGIEVLLWVLFILLGALVLIYVLKRRLPKMRIYLLLIIFVLGFLYIGQIRIVAERFHLIKYGLLGWFVLRDTMTRRRLYAGIAFSLIFCLLVASIDELFQSFLPYRVGEIHDIVLAAFGSVWGIGIFLIYSNCNSFK